MLGLSLLALYKYQDHLLYFPEFPAGSRSHFQDPILFKRTNSFEEVFVKAEDGVSLQCWLFKQKNVGEVPTLLYFHENAGNLSHRLDNIQDFYKNLEVNVFIVSYRGYGKSDSIPSEHGLRLDGKAALKYLLYTRKDIDPNRVVVFGRSLGGAVAIELCASIAEYGPKYITTPLSDLPPPSSTPRPPPRKRREEEEKRKEEGEKEGEKEGEREGEKEEEEEGEREEGTKEEEEGGKEAEVEEEVNEERRPACLIVENTFTSILDMIDEVFPLLTKVKFLSSNIFDSEKRIKLVDLPVLFISGKMDELVPHRMMKALFHNVRHNKKHLVIFTKGYHMTVWQLKGYAEHIQKFLVDHRV